MAHGNTKHGGARRSGRLPEYYVWHHMLQRCRCPSSADYVNYGARGITVCAQWNDFAVFLSDMGPRPSSVHTIERVDNDAGYSPGNCVWATRDVQARNRRQFRIKEVCRRGHPLSGDNLYQRPDGKRGCKACRHINMENYHVRHRG